MTPDLAESAFHLDRDEKIYRYRVAPVGKKRIREKIMKEAVKADLKRTQAERRAG